MAQNIEDPDPAVSESLFCAGTAGTAGILSESPLDSYPELKEWSDSFTDIARNAKKQTESFDNVDSETLDNRLVIIRRQTELNLERLDIKNNKTALSEFIEATTTKCAQFAN